MRAIWRRDFQRRLADGGYTAVHWPPEYGVQISDANVLGGVGNGWKVALTTADERALRARLLSSDQRDLKAVARDLLAAAALLGGAERPRAALARLAAVRLQAAPVAT